MLFTRILLFIMCLPVIAGDFTDADATAVQICSNDRVFWKTEDEKCAEKNEGFHCLEAVDSAVRYVQMCAVPILIHKGNYPVYNGITKTIEPKACSAETYQEHEAYSNESLFYKCLSSKTQSYSEGQLECGTPSTVKDRSFTCDFKNYYRFEDRNMNIFGDRNVSGCYSGLGAFCINVSEKDCNRTTHVLNAGFDCVRRCEDGGMRKETWPYKCMESKYPTGVMKTQHSTKSTPVTTTKAPENQKDNGILAPGEDVAIAATLVVLVFIIGLVIICVCRRRISEFCKKKQDPASTSRETTSFIAQEPIASTSSTSRETTSFIAQEPIASTSHEHLPDIELQPVSGQECSWTKLAEKDENEDLFVLDYIAGKCEPQTMKRVFISLRGNSDADIETIKNSYQSNPREQNFQMLYKWFRNCEDEKPYSFLEEALIENGRKDLTEERFDKEMFEYREEWADEEIKNENLICIGHNIGRVYPSFVRFFGFQQQKIENVGTDNHGSIEEQALKAITMCYKARLIRKKSDLCAALNYVEKKDLIIKLKPKTETSSV